MIGSGIGRGETDVNWSIAGRMGIAWVLTIPGAALVAAIAYGIVDLFGTRSVGRGRRHRGGDSIALYIKTREQDAADEELIELKTPIPAPA